MKRKLKVTIKNSNNVLLESEGQEEKVRADLLSKLRAETGRFSREENDIVTAFEVSLSANNSPVEFFKELGEISKNIQSDLSKLNTIFPGLPDLFNAIRNVSNAAGRDIESMQATEDGIEDLDIELEEQTEADNVTRDLRNQRDQISDQEEDRAKKLRDAMGGIDYSNLANAIKVTGLQKFTGRFVDDLNNAFQKLAKEGTDPAVFFSNNPDALLDLRTVFHSLNILSRFQNIASKHRSKLKGIYKSGDNDFESAINNVQRDGDQLMNDFREEFKDLRVKELVAQGSREFNNKILSRLFRASDVATGGKVAAAQKRSKEAGDYVAGLEDAPTGVVENTLRSINMSNLNEQPTTDPDYEEAMRELQSDPLTQTFEEYQQQAAEELRQAANDQSVTNLSKVAALVIRAFASYKKLRKERRADFAKRFLEKAKTNYDEAERQLMRMVEFLKQPLGDTLEKYIDGDNGIKEKLIGLRRKVKDAKNNDEIPEERAAGYISIINDALVQIAETRKQFVEQSKQTINENPDGYLEFLEDVESFLKARNNKVIKEVKEKFSQVKAGETPQDNAPAEESDPNALKNLSVGKINVALNQLRQKGISAKDLSDQIEDAIQTISRGAGPQRRNFQERDVPVINKIKDELVKILNGDFSNLIRENKSYLKVHNKTYKIINLIALGKF